MRLSPVSILSWSSFLVALAPLAGQGPAPLPQFHPEPRVRDQMHYDRQDQGELWVAGVTYKACFGRESFTYVPFLGSDAPHDYPVRFELGSVRVGERDLKVRRDVEPRREGDRVVYDRGPIQEIYDLTPRTVEQTFRVTEADADGDVVVTLQVSSELAASATDGAVQFANERGRVEYQRAFVVDAAGKRPIATTWADGALRLVVPQSLRQGHAPVTIDPVIETYTTADPYAKMAFWPQVAFDAQVGVYVLTWNTQWSVSDSDVMSEMRAADGSAIPGSRHYIDFTTLDWFASRVGVLVAHDQALVAAMRNVNGGWEIAGRVRSLREPTRPPGAVFTVSGPESGNKQGPVVGGNPSTSTPGYWVVAYTRVYSPTDTDIHARRIGWDPVRQTAVVAPATILVDNSAYSLDAGPSISKSCGMVEYGAQRFLVTWLRRSANGNLDTLAAVLGADGHVTRSTFVINNSAELDYVTHASSMVDQDGRTVFLAATQHVTTVGGYPFWRVMGTVVDESGAVLVPLTNITALTGISRVQRSWDVDSDGTQFYVLFAEHTQIGTYYNVVPVLPSGGALVIPEPEANVYPGNAGTSWPIGGLVCDWSGGGSAGRCHALVSINEGSWVIQAAVITFGGNLTGSIQNGVPGCGGLTLAAGGYAAPGGLLAFGLDGAGADERGLLLGTPHPGIILGNGCALGVAGDLPWIHLPARGRVELRLPTGASLTGLRFAAQGWSFAPGRGDAAATLRTSNSAVITLR